MQDYPNSLVYIVSVSALYIFKYHSVQHDVGYTLLVGTNIHQWNSLFVCASFHFLYEWAANPSLALILARSFWIATVS